MFHGGKSTGPITFSGKQRCAVAKTIHGRETRIIREKRAQKLAEMKFTLIYSLNFKILFLSSVLTFLWGVEEPKGNLTIFKRTSKIYS